MLHGLSCEWEVALWVLDDSHRELLQKPMFSLRDMDTRLGSWEPEKKEISLSRSFVLNHSWYAVREVLVHELAHQVAHQVFGAYHEAAHGPSFKKACDLLRIDPKASGHYRVLTNGAEVGQSDKLLLRIKKLLALAESQNSHEAEAAMLKAHMLIEKYHVDVLALEQKRAFVSLRVGPSALRHSRDRYHLANLLQDFYFVHGIWVPAYVVAKGKMGRALEISGTAQNVEMAAYVYDFISNYIQRQWMDYNHEARLHHRRRTDFAVGVLEGFRKKLTRGTSQKPRKTVSGALLTVKDPQLKNYLAFKYPRIRNVRRDALRVDRNVIRDGVAAGENLVISKGITEKGQKGKLIGHKSVML